MDAINPSLTLETGKKWSNIIWLNYPLAYMLICKVCLDTKPHTSTILLQGQYIVCYKTVRHIECRYGIRPYAYLVLVQYGTDWYDKPYMDELAIG